MFTPKTTNISSNHLAMLSLILRHLFPLLSPQDSLYADHFFSIIFKDTFSVQKQIGRPVLGLPICFHQLWMSLDCSLSFDKPWSHLKSLLNLLTLLVRRCRLFLACYRHATIFSYNAFTSALWFSSLQTPHIYTCISTYIYIYIYIYIYVNIYIYIYIYIYMCVNIYIYYIYIYIYIYKYTHMYTIYINI